jgi:hypothetical protein
MGDLDGDGRAARVDNQPNSLAERQRARRKAADLALGTNDPRQALRTVLDQLDLNPTQGEPR